MTGEQAKGRELVYDSLLYGLGAALGDLAGTEKGREVVEEINKKMGRYIAEYLSKRGVDLSAGETPEETVQRIVKTFTEDLEFGRIEHAEPTPDRGTHAVWRDLLGHSAYEELAKKYPDPFLACPLNAVLRAVLERHGYTLVVHGCSSDYSKNLLESWEEVRKGTSFLKQAST